MPRIIARAIAVEPTPLPAAVSPLTAEGAYWRLPATTAVPFQLTRCASGYNMFTDSCHFCFHSWTFFCACAVTVGVCSTRNPLVQPGTADILRGVRTFDTNPSDNKPTFKACCALGALSDSVTVSPRPQVIVCSSRPGILHGTRLSTAEEKERKINRKRRQGEGLWLVRWGKGCPASGVFGLRKERVCVCDWGGTGLKFHPGTPLQSKYSTREETFDLL